MRRALFLDRDGVINKDLGYVYETQNFYFNVKSHDGTQQNFPFETGSLTADTWTKITKTISGNSNLQFDNNTSTGFELRFNLFLGTDFTANGTSLDTWAAYASGTHCPDFTSTWYTTNDATFEMTGLQIEVSSIATDFEHRSYGDELDRCQRYYQAQTDYHHICINNGESDRWIRFMKPMRAAPTVTTSPTNSVSFAAQNQEKEGFAGNGSGGGSANFNLEWTASAEL